MKTKTLSLVLIPLLAYLSTLPTSQAVNPPPDGGYPGFNTAEGQNALFSLTTGSANTAVGWFSLQSNLVGNLNTAIGAGTLLANTADNNTATGAGALLNNTTGENNTAIGVFALFDNTTGGFNTATGFGTLSSNTTGDSNTAIGTGALGFNSTGSENVALGEGAGGNVTTATNVICIDSDGANVNNSCFIGHIRGVTTQNADAMPVLIDSVGQLGTMSSSKRFKKAIKPMDSASEAVLALKPVSFHYKSDNTNTPQFGLIAEEVAAVNPDLVVRDQNGEIYSVRYDAVNAMLLNEFLKEYRKVQEQNSKIQQQEATITELKSTVAQQQKDFQATAAHQQKQIEAVTAGLQKVSVQLETSKTAPQTVSNR